MCTGDDQGYLDGLFWVEKSITLGKETYIRMEICVSKNECTGSGVQKVSALALFLYYYVGDWFKMHASQSIRRGAITIRDCRSHARALHSTHALPTMSTGI